MEVQDLQVVVPVQPDVALLPEFEKADIDRKLGEERSHMDHLRADLQLDDRVSVLLM